MTVSKGDVWLANLNPQKRSNEIGKTRPVVVIQSNLLNQSDYSTVIVLPMTTVLIHDSESLRFRVKKMKALVADSDA